MNVKVIEDGRQLPRRRPRNRPEHGHGHRERRVSEAGRDGQPGEPVRQRSRARTGQPTSTTATRTSGATSRAETSPKVNGDAYQAGDLRPADADNCPGGVNTDYDSNGYYYTDPLQPARARFNLSRCSIPGSCEVGDNCPATSNGSNLSGAAALATRGAGWPGVRTHRRPSATRRWRAPLDQPHGRAPRHPFCTGDHYFGNRRRNCRDQLHGASARAAVPVSRRAATDRSAARPPSPVSIGDLADRFARATRKVTTRRPPQFLGDVLPAVVRRCARSPVSAGQDYFIQIKGDANGQRSQPVRRSEPQNGSGTVVSISGNTKMGDLRERARAAPTRSSTWLASSASGEGPHARPVDLFDIGDGAAPPERCRSCPPGTRTSGGTFAGCTYTAPPGNSTGRRSGTVGERVATAPSRA